MLPKNFKATDRNESSKYYFVDLEKHGLPRKELLNKFFSEFMDTFITNADEVEEIIKLKALLINICLSTLLLILATL
jgi:hypothetical protein